METSDPLRQRLSTLVGNARRLMAVSVVGASAMGAWWPPQRATDMPTRSRVASYGCFSAAWSPQGAEVQLDPGSHALSLLGDDWHRRKP